jgi:chemotaxis protein CheD
MSAPSSHKHVLAMPAHSTATDSMLAPPLNSHFLHPGHMYVSREPANISLILGSCVAVCMWDPVSGVGGATHFLLPTWDGRGTATPRYGSVAVPLLLQKLGEAGADRSQLRAKLFGGGCLFDMMREGGLGKEHLGTRNIETAKDLLAKAQIRIVSSDLGGERGKRVEFYTRTGETVVKAL